MAEEKKKQEKGKTVIEREYNVPLRREFIKAPRWKSTQKAAKGLRKFLMKHMKQEDPSKIKIGKDANELLWRHGIKNPPHHIKLNVKKDDKGIVTAEIPGKEAKEKASKEEKDKETGKKEEKPQEEAKKTKEKPEAKEKEEKEVPEKKTEKKDN